MAYKEHTIIFVPYARARFIKWRVSSRRLLVFFTALVLGLLANVAFLVISLNSIGQPREPVTASLIDSLEDELGTASKQVLESLRNAEKTIEKELAESNRDIERSRKKTEVAIADLFSSVREQEAELNRLRASYEALEALAAGQEDIARAHAEILRRRPLMSRLLDIGASLAIGVLTTLLATILLSLRKVPADSGQTDAE